MRSFFNFYVSLINNIGFCNNFDNLLQSYLIQKIPPKKSSKQKVNKHKTRVSLSYYWDKTSIHKTNYILIKTYKSDTYIKTKGIQLK